MRESQRMGYPARLVTAEEFARIPDDDHRYELVEGRVVRMSPPGAVHAVRAARIGTLFQQHVDAHRVGVVLSSGGFKLAVNPDTVREPDVAFVRREHIPADGIPEGFWPGPADLVVEIRSPGDRRSEILAKVEDYLTRGVQLVLVVDPRLRNIIVYRRLMSAITFGVDETLDVSDVMPGFSCEVRRFFE